MLPTPFYSDWDYTSRNRQAVHRAPSRPRCRSRAPARPLASSLPARLGALPAGLGYEDCSTPTINITADQLPTNGTFQLEHEAVQPSRQAAARRGGARGARLVT